MSRLTQCADKYAKNAFVKHFEMQQACYGLNTQASVASKVGVSQCTVGNHLKDPDKIPVGVLRKYKKTLKLNPVILLELFGVTQKEAKEALVSLMRSNELINAMGEKEKC